MRLKGNSDSETGKSSEVSERLEVALPQGSSGSPEARGPKAASSKERSRPAVCTLPGAASACTIAGALLAQTTPKVCPRACSAA